MMRPLPYFTTWRGDEASDGASARSFDEAGIRAIYGKGIVKTASLFIDLDYCRSKR